MFKHGESVVTSQKYFNQFGRKVYGTVFEHEKLPKSDHVVVVRWERQQGNIISEHQDKLVIMMVEDLEKQ